MKLGRLPKSYVTTAITNVRIVEAGAAVKLVGDKGKDKVYSEAMPLSKAVSLMNELSVVKGV